MGRSKEGQGSGKVWVAAVFVFFLLMSRPERAAAQSDLGFGDASEGSSIIIVSNPSNFYTGEIIESPAFETGTTVLSIDSGEIELSNAALFSSTGLGLFSSSSAITWTPGLMLVPSAEGTQVYAVSSNVVVGASTNLTGTFTFDLTASGLAPAVSIASGIDFLFDLGAGGTSSNVLVEANSATTGQMAFSNDSILLDDLTGGSLSAGTYTLFASTQAGTFTGLTLAANPNADGSYDIESGLTLGESIFGDSLQLEELGDSIVVDVTPTPEPPSLVLFLIGGAAMLFLLRGKVFGTVSRS